MARVALCWKIISNVVILSTIVSLAHSIVQVKFKKIIALSSVFRLNWIILSMISSTRLWVVFFSVYRVLSYSLVAMLSYKFISHSANNQNLKLKVWQFSLAVLILAGVPPSPLFIIKVSVLMDIVGVGLGYLATVIIFASIAIIFMYMNLIINLVVFSNRVNRTRVT